MLDSTGTLVVTAGFLYVETETKGNKTQYWQASSLELLDSEAA